MSQEGGEGRAGCALKTGTAGVGFRPDAAGTIWKDGSFWSDCWREAPAEGPLPEGPVIVSKKRWLADKEALAASGAPLGLRLEPGEPLDDLAGELARFQLIALSFPTYSDGRAFSTARLLREKYGYAGELRAVGNVLNDQIGFMRRVGFDTLAVTHEPTRRALAEKRIAQVTLHYQPTGVSEPAAGKRPWLRRAPV
jgi:phosphoadenosine phosphosulfate reductase